MAENKLAVVGKKDSSMMDYVADKLKQLKRADGWSNILTGLGRRDKDARMASVIQWNRMSEHDMENLYAGDGMAAKVVDLPVDEATEKGYKLTGIENTEAIKISDAAKLLFFDDAVKEAARTARLYGGAAILKVYDDDLDLAAPVRVAPGGKPPRLKSLVVFNRFDLQANWIDVNQNILSPDFGTPVYYTFTGRGDAAISNIRIHYSRLVIFNGTWLPTHLYRANGYWHDTVFGKLYDAIRNYSNAHDGVNAAVKDFSVSVYKIKGLADAVANDCDDQILKRVNIVNMSKSMIRAILVDADGESYETQSRNVTGAEKLVEAAEDRLTAESGMPHTVLLGSSPTGGLGQTGNHEAKNWQKWVSSYQDAKLREPMLEILREIAIDQGVDSTSLAIEFNPLEEQTEKEMIEMRKAQAEVDKGYIDSGVLDAAEVRQSRFGGETYSTDTEIDESLDPVAKKSEEEFKQNGV